MNNTINQSIEFWTPTDIDPISWSVMGINAKPDSDNPIGLFGTGLKYAIAVLLRTGHTIQITNKDKTYDFKTIDENFRGKKFQICTCNDERLAFTTELGKNWEVWMAYRELVCNTKDEGGFFGSHTNEFGGSLITVNGPSIYKCWKNHENYFCETYPTETVVTYFGDVELHKGSGIIYYRGVKIGEVERSAFNYNILGELPLTEDRTIKDYPTLKTRIVYCISNLKNKEAIRKIYTNKKGWESELNLEYVTLSEEVLEEITEIWEKDPSSLIPSAIKRLKIQKPNTHFKEIEMDQRAKMMLSKAKSFLSNCGYNINAEIKLISNENDSVIAFVHEKVIHLTERSFEKGVYDLTQTLMEEHFHTLGFMDESRGFEKYLMDQLISAHNKSIGFTL